MKSPIACAAVAALLAASGMAHAQAADAAPGPSQQQRQAVTEVLQRNADEQSSLAADLAHGKLSPQAARYLQARQAGLYRMEALALALGAGPARLQRVEDRQEREVVVFAPPKPATMASAEARATLLHERVAAQRDAEQQRAIAKAWADGQLTLREVAELEATQSQLARVQVMLARDGHESSEAAQLLQHLQNLQDWAILQAASS